MPLNPIRRAQLISPFGVGSLSVGRDGSIYLMGALDYWFDENEASDKNVEIDIEEYRVEEWRLQRLLGVDGLRLPPDYRANRSNGQQRVNLGLTVPVFRFPSWNVCPACGLLKDYPLTIKSKQKCPSCDKKGLIRYMTQVQLIAMCENGHIQDFPWREWVHADDQTECREQMHLSKMGAATIGLQTVSCDCGAKRSLANVMSGSMDRSSTFLSDNLNRSPKAYLCSGSSPWLGTNQPQMTCEKPLRAALTNATNVYFADTKSAIYLPRHTDRAPSGLIDLLQEAPLNNLVVLMAQNGFDRIKPSQLRLQQPALLKPYSDEQITASLKIIGDGYSRGESTIDMIDDYDGFEKDLLPMEYEQLRREQNEVHLQVSLADPSQYDPSVGRFFSTIALVKKLRETRALMGFSRITSNSGLSLEQKKKMLFRTPPAAGESWLPATMVHGEGIFLEFNPDLISKWEKQPLVQLRVKGLVDRYKHLEITRNWCFKELSARFVMIHTLAHVLINQLTFECGYSAASLRERLYVTQTGGIDMAGVLIYTASGDSEGTLGGLVAMGRPGFLEPTILKALEKAKWCSADPVCMEIGSSGGQGPESCNLAACHNCALVPETSCEEGNRFLDRALLIGDPISGADIGFFV